MPNMNKPIVINFLGEPSVGKSTAATYVFSHLKMKGINCEYISEFAKDKVYEECDMIFKHQEYIFGKQAYKMARVANKVDIIITDSPLILSAVYNEDSVLGENFNKTVLSVFNSYKNLNILLFRQHSYQHEGRLQDEASATIVRKRLIDKLTEYKIPIRKIGANSMYYDQLIDEVIEKIERRKNDEQ